MATIANLVIKISAKSEGVQKAINKATAKIKAFAKTAGKILAGVGGLIGAGAGAAVFAITRTVNKYAAEIDKLGKTSSKLGITTEALQKLQYQGELSGVSVNTMNMALQRMVRRVSEASAGTGAAKDALKELGLNAQLLNQMSPDQQFYAISEAMKGIGNQGDKVRLAMKIFDTEGVSLVNTMGSNLSLVGQEFDSLGISITNSQAAMVESYNDSKSRLSAIFSGFGIQLTAQLAEPFTKLVNNIGDTIIEMGGLKVAANEFAIYMVNAIIGTIKAVSELVKAFLKVENAMLHIENIKLAPAVALDALAALDANIRGEDHTPSKSAQQAFANVNRIEANNKAVAENKVVKGLEDLVKDLEANKPQKDPFAGGAAITEKHATALTGIIPTKTKDSKTDPVKQAAERAKADEKAAEKTNELAKAAGDAAAALTPEEATSEEKAAGKAVSLGKKAKSKKTRLGLFGAEGLSDISSRFAATGLSASLEGGSLFGSAGSRSSGLTGQGETASGKVLSLQGYIDRSPTGKKLQDIRKGTNAFRQSGTDGEKKKGKQTVITLNMITDAGEVAGELIGDQSFVREIAAVGAKQANQAAKQAAG